jgi:nucleoside-diphosphate-sugar epimerase
MRVFLAGASGVMGRELIPRLLADGHEVVGTTRTRGSLDGSGATEFVGDVRDRAAFIAASSALHCDAVIHQLTAYRKPPRTFRRMAQTNRLRSEGTNTLIASARAMGATTFIAASSVYGYGFGRHGDIVLDESSRFGKETVGPLLAVESALGSLEQQVRAIGGVCLRYGILYAPGGRIPPIPKDADGVLPFVALSDAADATILALTRAKPGSTYNIVDDEPVSWRTLHEARALAAGAPAPTEYRSRTIAFAAPFAADLVTRTSLRVSNSLAKTELGWVPEYPSYRHALSPASVGSAP